MNSIQQISDSELILMRIIWESGGTALFADIMEQLERQGLEWKKNTVLTFLSRLQEKKMLSTNKIGRRNEYTALVTEQAYTAEQTKTFVNRVYAGDAGGLVANLLRQDMISPADVEELKKFWEEDRK